MQTPRSGRSIWLLRLLTILAVAVFAVPAAAGEVDRAGPAGGARADGPAQLAQACPRIYRPVCAFVGGRWQTFGNSCVARSRGARLIRQGACRAADNRRFCCVRGNRRFFTSRRDCRRAGGRIAADRVCRAPRTCHQRRTSRRFAHIRGRSWHPACRNAPPQRTCHQRGTSRRFTHIRGRSWPRACQAGPRPRTCHQRGTSRRFNHVRGRSWPRACSGAGTGGGGRAKPRAGTPCTGKGRHGVTFKGRIVVDRNGIATCLAGSGRP